MLRTSDIDGLTGVPSARKAAVKSDLKLPNSQNRTIKFKSRRQLMSRVAEIDRSLTFYSRDQHSRHGAYWSQNRDPNFRKLELHLNNTNEPVGSIRDLSEFCELWPELRENVLGHIESDTLMDGELRATLKWLCLLSDRICAQASDFEL